MPEPEALGLRHSQSLRPSRSWSLEESFGDHAVINSFSLEFGVLVEMILFECQPAFCVVVRTSQIFTAEFGRCGQQPSLKGCMPELVFGCLSWFVMICCSLFRFVGGCLYFVWCVCMCIHIYICIYMCVCVWGVSVCVCVSVYVFGCWCVCLVACLFVC